MSWSVDPAPIGSGIGLPRPRLDDGRGRTVLIWSVVLLAVVGLVGVVWLAARAGDFGGAAAALILAGIPVPFLLAAYLWLDRYEPEPTRFVAAALLWGAVISTFGAGLVQELLAVSADPPEWVAVVVVAPVFEELLKGTLVVLVLVRRRKVSRLLDGFVYAGLVGVGFAFTENVLYISGAYAGLLVPEFDGPQAASTVFALRGLMSPFAHPLFTTAIGIGMAVAVVTSRRWLRYLAPPAGYAVAVGLHATWNGSTMLWQGLGFLLTYAVFMVPLFAVAVYVAMRALRAEAAVIRAALMDAASRGWLNPAEVHWLVNYGDRAAARRFASQVAGRPAGKALHAYQRAATEMALMHDRVLRGRAPEDGPARVEAHLRRMHSWRPFLVMPPPNDLPRRLQPAGGQPPAR